MIELLLTAIPIEEFDQRKLETLLRRIPEAYVRTEASRDFDRRFYAFPKTSDEGFIVKCSADHYRGAAIPSQVTCTMEFLGDLDPRYDEQLVETRSPEVVGALFKAISYGKDEKEFFSSERVKGRGLNGKVGENFRFNFRCSHDACLVTMVPKRK